MPFPVLEKTTVFQNFQKGGYIEVKNITYKTSIGMKHDQHT